MHPDDVKAIDAYTEIVRREAAKDAEIARLQEQVETLTRSRDEYRELAHDRTKAWTAAEVERDRLREALDKIAEADFEQSKSELHDFVTGIALAVLQKEPQP